MSKIVVNKGYTITVISWENDGDNYNTKSITVDTIEKAKAYYDLMQLCKSKNNQKPGVIKLGNSTEFSGKQEKVIVEFLKANLVLLEGDDVNNATDDQFISWFGDIISELLGSSEYYQCRVMEQCEIIYSPENVLIKEIKF